MEEREREGEFPASVQGHNLGDDVADHLVIGASLFRMKPGAKAFPSIQLIKEDDLDVRAASNGRFLYFWAKKKLFAVSMEQIVTSARFQLSGKTEKKSKPKDEAVKQPEPAKEPPATEAQKPTVVCAVKRKVTCSRCREMDIDLFSGTEGNQLGKNGWLIAEGKAICPTCR